MIVPAAEWDPNSEANSLEGHESSGTCATTPIKIGLFLYDCDIVKKLK